jgi:hypothetical protein
VFRIWRQTHLPADAGSTISGFVKRMIKEGNGSRITFNEGNTTFLKMQRLY